LRRHPEWEPAGVGPYPFSFFPPSLQSRSRVHLQALKKKLHIAPAVSPPPLPLPSPSQPQSAKCNERVPGAAGPARRCLRMSFMYRPPASRSLCSFFFFLPLFPPPPPFLGGHARIAFAQLRACLRSALSLAAQCRRPAACPFPLFFPPPASCTDTDSGERAARPVWRGDGSPG